MDYKKLIKSRSLRIKIMQALSFVPDEIMVKIQYRMKTGRKLNLKNPQRFTEKLQWYKLYYRDPLMAQCADKYEVRKYVEECGLGHILNEMYGIYDSPDEVDFSKLPESFVIKDTLGGGGNSVILVKDKSKMDEVAVRAKLQEWVNEPTNKKHPGREWVYDGRKHRIIIEKFIDSDVEQGGLIDYKFFCFNGKAEYLYVMSDRQIGGTAGLSIYNSEFKRMAVKGIEKPLARNLKKPEKFEEMKKMAEILSEAFPEARIDFYNMHSNIVFGEITFFDASGYMIFEPDEFDYVLGERFVVPMAHLGGGN